MQQKDENWCHRLDRTEIVTAVIVIAGVKIVDLRKTDIIATMIVVGTVRLNRMIVDILFVDIRIAETIEAMIAIAIRLIFVVLTLEKN